MNCLLISRLQFHNWVSVLIVLKRWNHHRLSKSSLTAVIHTEVTDNLSFGVCAKCELTGIHFEAKYCTRCGHFLGDRGKYFEPPAKQLLPSADCAPFLVFECAFPERIGCRIQGAGPVVITAILDHAIISAIPEGTLIAEHRGGVPDLATRQLIENYVYSHISGAAPPAVAVSAYSSLPRADSGSLPLPPPPISSNSAGADAAPVAVAVAEAVPAGGAAVHAMPTAAVAVAATPVQGRVISASFPIHSIPPAGTHTTAAAAVGLRGDIASNVEDPVSKYDPTASPWNDPVVALANEKQRCLKPMIGDVLVSVNGIPVSHLDFNQV
jgi:hypothetical protein